ncbi:MAG: hypothetical protein J5582_13950 [Ruminococcus sp.]|uniref:hypothetical protein n=1 Tax=Ruminococcus sp. TaxID=41978 RepID=UPI0025FF487C|nr:hypothetical protein [Ruminococcus sp.]MBO4867641.1 hypothetical protein [Ruminococcus sp.]
MKANNTREYSKIKNRFPIAVISVAACAALVMGLTSCSNNNDQTDLSAAAKDSSTNISVDNTNETNIVSETTESSVSNDVQNDPVGDSNISSDNSSDNSEAGNNQTEKVEMSVDKMLSMDGKQLRALSNDNYEIIDGASAQSASFGLKCAAFPEYVFVLKRVEYNNDKPENTIKVPIDDYVFELGDEIEQLNLYEGANVGSGVTVGMTYNEIEEQLGHDIEVSMVNTSLGLAAWTEIDGRYWALHFDVTDVPDDEIWKRLEESTEGGEINLDDPGHADLSDINPVCDLAVFDIEADNWHYGRI